jgi:hypothetical protein
MTTHQKQIVLSWERHEQAEPEIYTEQLMARVCSDCNCDAGHVAEALEQQAIENKENLDL